MSVDELAVFWAIVGSRLFVPLLIPRFPLPAIVACLLIDAADQTIFQWFGYEPPGYQGYDKAMDVYYLAIAYIASLRNWTSRPALRIGRFLYFYRLVGVVAFELLDVRAILLIFPNTFEYFFIAYEGIRSRWDPARLSARFWLRLAAFIWIFIKLPQEWWIHVAQLDFTETWQNVLWFAPLIVIGLMLLAAIAWFVVRPRLAPPDWAWRFAAEPLPPQVDEATERAAWIRSHARVWSGVTLEKVLLVGLISVVFGQVLPSVDSTPLELFIGIAILVVVNVAFTMSVGSRLLTVESVYLAGGARLAFNLLTMVALDALLVRTGGSTNLADGFFFLVLLSLLTTLHDRYRPVAGVRFGDLTPEVPDAVAPRGA